MSEYREGMGWADYDAGPGVPAWAEEERRRYPSRLPDEDLLERVRATRSARLALLWLQEHQAEAEGP